MKNRHKKYFLQHKVFFDFNKSLYWSSSIFLILALLGAIVFISLSTEPQSEAANINTSTQVENEAAQIDSIFVSGDQNDDVNYHGAYGLYNDFTSGILLKLGDYRTLYINGVAHDNNSESDITGINLQYYRSGKGGVDGSGCSEANQEDKNDCYLVTSCSIDDSYGNSTEVKYSCQINAAFWADATDIDGPYDTENWVARVSVTDHEVTASLTSSHEMNTLLALNIPISINYGTLNLGEQTTASTGLKPNQKSVITQNGNAQADVEVKGGNMYCDVIGYLATSTQEWSLGDVGFGNAISHTLTDSFVKTHLDVDYRTDDVNPKTGDLYWNLGVPLSGVKGVCTGSNTIVVVSSTGLLGQLQDSPMINVNYYSDSYTGVTDANGYFQYASGETITFKIGSTTLGSISSIPTDKAIFPQDIVGVSRDNMNDQKVVNLMRFVQSLDDDENPLNGIQITDDVKIALENSNQDIQTQNEATLVTLINTAYVGRELIATSSAQAHMNNSVATAIVTPNVSLYTRPGGVIGYNASTTLFWETNGVSSCVASEGWSGSKTNSGYIDTGLLTVNTTYALHCVNNVDSSILGATTTVMLNQQNCILEQSTIDCVFQ